MFSIYRRCRSIDSRTIRGEVAQPRIGCRQPTNSLSTVRTDNIPKVRFSTTPGDSRFFRASAKGELYPDFEQLQLSIILGEKG